MAAVWMRSVRLILEDLQGRGASASERLVFLALLLIRDKEKLVHLSNDTLCTLEALTGIHQSAVQSAMSDLAKRGLIAPCRDYSQNLPILVEVPYALPTAGPPKGEQLDDRGIAAELAGLELYEHDKRLCARWPDLMRAWRLAYPAVNIMHEVRAAHAWEVANPLRRKKDRARFLANWLARCQDRPCSTFAARRADDIIQKIDSEERDADEADDIPF